MMNYNEYNEHNECKNKEKKSGKEKGIEQTEKVEFKIFTLNTKGMNDYNKKIKIKNHMKNNNYDITMIQETWLERGKEDLKGIFQEEWKIDTSSKSRERAEKDYKEKKLNELNYENRMKGKQLEIFVNQNEAKMSEGTATFLKRKWGSQVTAVEESTPGGRYVITLLRINTSEILMFANIYAPATGERDSDEFFIGLKKKIKSLKENITKEFELSIIIGGDFNCIEDYKVDKKILNDSKKVYKGYKGLKSELELVDVYRTKFPEGKDFTFIKNQTGNGQETRIDRFLISPELVNRAKINVINFDETISGDHRGIELTIEVSTRNIKEIDYSKFNYPTRPLLKTKKKKEKMNKVVKEIQLRAKPDIKAFKKAVKEAENLGLYSLNEQAGNLLNAIENNLYNILKEEIGIKEKDKKGVNGFYIRDPKYKKLKWAKEQIKDLMMLSLKNTTQASNESLEQKIQTLNKEITDLDELGPIENDGQKLFEARKRAGILMGKRIQEMDKNRVQAAVETLRDSEINDPKYFFQRVKKEVLTRSKITHITTEDENGKEIIVDDPDLIVNKYWLDFWKNIYQSKKEDPGEDYNLKYCQGLKEKGTERVDTEFKEKRYQEAKERQENFKSPGASNIPIEVIKALSEDDDALIKDLLELCWKKEMIPKSWKSSIVQFIEKPGDITRLKNWRPISLLEVTYKIFTGMIYDNLKEYVEKNKILNDLQFGFREGKSIAQALFTCLSTIEDSNQFEKPIHIMKLDFSKAFDSMERWALIKTLKNYKVPEKLINLIQVIHEDNTATLFTPLGKTQNNIKIERGIRQGDVLSPLLFILFLNPLLDKLQQSGLGYSFANNQNLVVPFICFADDLTLIANSAEDLQKMIAIVEEFCAETGMDLNKDKCEYTCKLFGKEDVKNKNKINNKEVEVIPASQVTKLLGIEHNLDNTWEAQEDKSVNFLEWKLLELYSRCFTMKQKVRIINLLFTPKITYYLNITKFADEKLDKMDESTVKFLRRITKAQFNLNKEKFFDPNTIDLNSLRDEQECSLISTMYSHGFNANGEFPRKTLEQRKMDSAPGHRNTVQEVENILGKHGLKIEETEGKTKPLTKMPNINQNSFSKILDNDGKWKITIFTDGSVVNQDTIPSAGSAIVTNFRNILNPELNSNICFKTRMSQDSLTAELEAALGGVEVIPNGTENALIFMDCLTAIELIKKEMTEKERKRNANASVILNIQKKIKEKESTGTKIEFLWIPSHSLEKELNLNKQNRLEYLKKRFTGNNNQEDSQWDEILQSNSVADFMAKKGTKSAIQEETRIAENALKYSITKIDNGKQWEGNVRKFIKGKNKEIHENKVKEQIESYYSKEEINHKWAQLIFKEKDPKYDQIQRTLFRLMYGGLHSPNNRFDNYSKKRNFSTMVNQFKINNDMCEVPGCENCVADTNHILFECKAVEEKWKNFFEQNELEMREILEDPEAKLLPWFEMKRRILAKEVLQDDALRSESQEEWRLENKETLKERREGTARRMHEERESKRRRIENEEKEECRAEEETRKGMKQVKRKREESNENGEKKRKLNDEKNEKEKGKEREGPEKEQRNRVEVVQEEQAVVRGQGQRDEDKELSKMEIEEVAIKLKLTTKERMVTRRFAAKKRKVRKQTEKKRKLTSKEMGSNGFINKEITTQIEKYAKTKTEREAWRRESCATS